jgi:hypothetical protein
MKPKFVLDASLRPYATERQWKVLSALDKHGSRRKAAKALGIHHTSVRDVLRAVLRKAAQQGYAPAHDIVHEVPEGLTLKGTSIRYDGAGNVEQYWNKTKVQGREPEETVQLPDPKTVVKVSKLYDNQGKVIQEWVSEKPEDVARERRWLEFAAELAAEMPRLAPVKAPRPGDSDLLVCFPVGDHHNGMLSWHRETGADYDLEIAEKLLFGATNYLMSRAPPADQALLAFLGDFFHYDSQHPVTPKSGNMLDADSRFPKMVRVGIRSVRNAITAALRRYSKLHVIVEIGNHDPFSSIFLMECLRNLYEREPRVTIDTSPSHYHYFEFGANLIGTHHGDMAKMDKLPGIMAADRPEAWGRTKYRMWITGHKHTREALDFPGCTVESFRVLPPVDAWAHNSGYRSQRAMNALVIHKDFGESERITVRPEMLRGAV